MYLQMTKAMISYMLSLLVIYKMKLKLYCDVSATSFSFLDRDKTESNKVVFTRTYGKLYIPPLPLRKF